MPRLSKALSAVLVIVSTSTFATPTINAISGDIAVGSTVTIEGHQFGENPNPTPSFWSTFDSNNPLVNLEQGTAIPIGSNSGWGGNGSSFSNDITIDKVTKFSENSASYAGHTNGFLKWPIKPDTSNKEGIFVSWWYMINGSPINGESNKFIRIWDKKDGDGTRISWTSMHLTFNGSSPKWRDWGGDVGAWNKMEIWVNSTRNEIKTWVNGVQTPSTTDFVKPNNLPLNIYVIGFEPHDSTKYPNIKFNFSDVYISDTLARVEISDKPNWNDAESTKHVQLPTQWSDSKILINLNHSTVSIKENAFFYVIDKDGNVNQKGYPVCGNCPKPPAGLEVE